MIMSSDHGIPSTGLDARPPPSTTSSRPRRAIRPCDACRRRKTRCVVPPGAQRCTVCHSRRADCTFDQKPPSRPSRSKLSGSNDPNTEPEPTLGANSGRTVRYIAPNTPFPDYHRGSDAIETAISLPGTSPSTHRRDSPMSTDGEQAASAFRRNVSSDHPEVSETSGSHNVSQATGDGDDSLGMAKTRFAELYGLTSDMEAILMRHRPYDPQSHEFRLETHRIRRVLQQDMGMEYPVTFHLAEDDKAIGYRADYQEQDIIEQCVAPYGPNLINLFWRIVHPSYPILYKRGFMEMYSNSYREVAAPLLGAVYLISLGWWSYDKELSNKSTPNASLLRKAVIKAIQNSYHRPKLSSIEATLILLQCKPEDAFNPDHTWSWGYTSQALAIGQALGLHLDASFWAIPAWERRLRRRLAWALYMQDKWTALVHGRPSHIQDDDWGVQDISDADFTDDDSDDYIATGSNDIPRTDVKAGWGVFIGLVTVSKTLSEVLIKFYSLRASRLQDTVELYQEALPILESLRSWYQNLPSSLLLGNPSRRQLCATGSLHIVYHGLMITILRRIIRSTALAPLCRDATILNNTRKLASEATHAATSFVLKLRPDNLEAFWFFSSGYVFSLIGSFLTLLLVTSRSETEKTHWRENLNEYLWNLRIMGKASEPIRYAVNRLEGAILRGMEHALSVNIDPTPETLVDRNKNPSTEQSQSFPVQNTFEQTWAINEEPTLSDAMGPLATPSGSDWLTPLLNEDLTNLGLEHFDWLGGM